MGMKCSPDVLFYIDNIVNISQVVQNWAWSLQMPDVSVVHSEVVSEFSPFDW